MSKYWQNHWAELDDPGYRHNTEAWVRFYAQELALYFPVQAVRCLELGCGEGTLYALLKHRFSFYAGLDFSLSMLDRFRSRFGDVNLICADAASLPWTGDTYDFVFSNQVCQYLDQGMLERNLEQVYRLLNPGGSYLIGNVPDLQLRLFYYAGALRGNEDLFWPGLLSRIGSILVKRKDNDIGNWYSRRFLCKLGSKYGFSCNTFSSSCYEYRFHALLTKENCPWPQEFTG